MSLLMANTFNWPNAIAQAIESYGLPSRYWFREWDLPYPAGLHYCHQVELGYLERFLGTLTQVSGDALFVLRVQQFFSPTMLDSFGITLMASKNIEDALRRTMNILDYVTDNIDFRLLQQDGEGLIQIHIDHTDHLPLCKTMMLGTTQKLMQILIAPDFCFKAVDVDFVVSDEQKSAFEAIFRCPLNTESAYTCLRFNPLELEAVLPGANDAMAELHEKMFYQRLNKSLENNIGLQVKNVLINHLPRGECSKIFVAEKLGMKSRTLQYRLEKEGISFKVLLENTRYELAQTYLRQNRSLTEIAHQLGYSDSSNFHRALKSWQRKEAGH